MKQMNNTSFHSYLKAFQAMYCTNGFKNTTSNLGLEDAKEMLIRLEQELMSKSSSDQIDDDISCSFWPSQVWNEGVSQATCFDQLLVALWTLYDYLPRSFKENNKQKIDVDDDVVSLLCSDGLPLFPSQRQKPVKFTPDLKDLTVSSSFAKLVQSEIHIPKVNNNINSSSVSLTKSPMNGLKPIYQDLVRVAESTNDVFSSSALFVTRKPMTFANKDAERLVFNERSCQTLPNKLFFNSHWNGALLPSSMILEEMYCEDDEQYWYRKKFVSASFAVLSNNFSKMQNIGKAPVRIDLVQDRTVQIWTPSIANNSHSVTVLELSHVEALYTSLEDYSSRYISICRDLEKGLHLDDQIRNCLTLCEMLNSLKQMCNEQKNFPKTDIVHILQTLISKKNNNTSITKSCRHDFDELVQLPNSLFSFDSSVLFLPSMWNSYLHCRRRKEFSFLVQHEQELRQLAEEIIIAFHVTTSDESQVLEICKPLPEFEVQTMLWKYEELESLPQDEKNRIQEFAKALDAVQNNDYKILPEYAVKLILLLNTYTSYDEEPRKEVLLLEQIGLNLHHYAVKNNILQTPIVDSSCLYDRFLERKQEHELHQKRLCELKSWYQFEIYRRFCYRAFKTISSMAYLSAAITVASDSGETTTTTTTSSKSGNSSKINNNGTKNHSPTKNHNTNNHQNSRAISPSTTTTSMSSVSTNGSTIAESHHHFIDIVADNHAVIVEGTQLVEGEMNGDDWITVSGNRKQPRVSNSSSKNITKKKVVEKQKPKQPQQTLLRPQVVTTPPQVAPMKQPVYTQQQQQQQQLPQILQPALLPQPNMIPYPIIPPPSLIPLAPPPPVPAAQLPQPPIYVPKICQYFLRGECRYGSGCRDIHLPPQFCVEIEPGYYYPMIN